MASHAPLSPRRFELILSALGVGALCMSAVWAWRGNSEASGMGLVLAVLTSGLWALSRSGHTRVAAILIVTSLNVVTLGGVSYFGGPRAHAPAFLMVVVMCSGLMVGWRGGAASLGICAAYLLADGWYGPPPWATGKIADTPGAITIDWVLALGLAGSLAIVAFYTTSQRIAEVIRSEADKEAALAEARAASEAKSIFLANMSHELRTPLTAILGYAELVEEEIDAPDVGDIRRIQGAGRHLLDLIDDVLDTARIEADRLELEDRSFDVSELVAEVVVLSAPQATAHGVELTVETEGVGAVVADPRRTRQILQNLLSNAFKYAPGAPVHVRAERAGDRVRLSVRDHGPGIPQGVLPTLFEPFSRGHGTELQGTGLGLALASKLAERMGGALSVESSSEGTTFVLELTA